MLRLFNTSGKKIEPFRPAGKKVVNIFTCGPSVYQRSHIGNFRTFLFEDVLVRYLEYSGYKVLRGMNFTDIEDKAIAEAELERKSIKAVTDKHIREFLREARLLGMKIPDYLPRASDPESIDEAAWLIQRLLERKIAYFYRGNVYFDPLKSPGFGELYGLDMRKWPKKKVRFHKDTYPGMRWNLGDFILWHGCKEGDMVCRDTAIGSGRPSWNIEDPSMVIRYFHETLSVYCGGIDNLYRHHDYIKAILESVMPYPAARFWLHCRHLLVNSRKMSKSKGNILYTDMLGKKGYTYPEIRFFLIYGHYREELDYSDASMRAAAGKLRDLRRHVRAIERKAGNGADSGGGAAQRIRKVFTGSMDNDLAVKGAIDGLGCCLAEITRAALRPSEAAGIAKALREIDGVLGVLL
ncbi:MAG TPA: hypothetical protein VF790_09920 [Dissulfurispiraceae bacterium]